MTTLALQIIDQVPLRRKQVDTRSIEFSQEVLHVGTQDEVDVLTG